MFNINQKWTKAVLTSCPHGNHACTVAQDNVMAIVEDRKPDERICLGDLDDFAALRAGATGTSDEYSNLEEDYKSARQWQLRYRPTKRCDGNHDVRIRKLLNDPRGRLSMLAKLVVNGIDEVDRENHTEVKPYHQKKGWFLLGDVKAGHGWMYNEQAIRDHAETYGEGRYKVIHGHLHVPGMAYGRTANAQPAYCVGLLGDPDKFDYAHTRRNWLRWAHGIAIVEYTDTQSRVELITARCNHGEPEVWG